MTSYEDEPTPVDPEHRQPTADEIQAIVDTIDILIASSDTPPYDVESLPTTIEDQIAYMVDSGVSIAGAYPADVPKIPLIPVDDLSEFAIKRFPRESAAFNPGFPPTVAMVMRRTPRPELGIDGESYEVAHIQETSDGLKIFTEGTTRSDKEVRPAREFFGGIHFSAANGLDQLTAADCVEITDQLSRTAVLV